MEVKEYYEKLFSDKDKVAAFDKIAERYFMQNFAMMSKSEFETLLFSIYIEAILDKEGDEKYELYSDGRISKLLGVTQSKVVNLKRNKQLRYPREYNWQLAFNRHAEKYRYENNKIKILIPDPNLYDEINNYIENNGLYIEMSYNKKLMTLNSDDFINLLIFTNNVQSVEDGIAKLENKIKKQTKTEIKLDRENPVKSIKQWINELPGEVAKSTVSEIFNVGLLNIVTNFLV